MRSWPRRRSSKLFQSQPRLQVEKGKHPESLLNLLEPKPGQPLHYTVEHNPGIEFMPYWQVDKQPFNCFPGVHLHT